MVKRSFSSHLAGDEITIRGYRVLTSAVCITIMIAELTVMSVLGSSQDEIVWVWNGLDMVWFEMVFGVEYMELCDP
jgi:hypothetical protein